MNNIRVLYISRAYGKQSGGMERLSFEFAHAIRQNHRLNITTIVNKTNPNARLISARIRSTLFTITVMPKALRAAKQSDIIHLGDPVLSLVGWLTKKLYKKPVVMTVHGLDVSYPNPIYQTYLKVFARQFDLYLPISQHAKTVLQNLHPTGKVEVVNPGLSDETYNPHTTRQQLVNLLEGQIEITRDTKILFTLGRLVPRKGHNWFIEQVLPQLPVEYKYIIAGDGPERHNIEATINKHNLSKRVILLGKVDQSTKSVLLNAADAFIQPNIPTTGDAEGFGLVLLEAALCNLPVLASNIEGISDAIEHGENGHLLPPRIPDAWVKAIKQTPPIKNAREYTLRKFSWPQITAQYESLVQKLTIE